MSLIRRSDKGQPLSAADHDANLKRLEGFADLPALLAERSGYGFYREGEIIMTRAEGFRYRVVAAEGAQLVTAGGLGLEVLPTDDGVLNFRAFAPAADGKTDDYGKLRAAIDALPSGGTLFFPDGTYFLGQTVFLKKVVHLKGTRSGLSGGRSAILKFPLDTAGLKFERGNTLNGTVEAVASGASDGSIIEGLAIEGTRGSDKTKHGIHAVCRILIRNCSITRFSGDGVHLYGASDQCSPGKHQAICGNANLCQVYLTQASQNGGSGFYIRGYDANAGLFQALDAVSNGRWGIVDLSFLGNTHIGHHVAFNGNANHGGNPADASAFVSHGGRRYSACTDATAMQLVETEPGTNHAVWSDSGSGETHAVVPAWLPSQPVGTYFPGGAYWFQGNNARNILLNLYSEGGQAQSSIIGPSMSIGGLYGSGFSNGGTLTASTGGHLSAPSVSAGGSDGASAQIAPHSRRNAAFRWQHATAGEIGGDSHPWELYYSSGNWEFRNGGLGARVAAYITSTASTQTFGTDQPVPYVMGFSSLGIGAGKHARRQTSGNAAPTSGNRAQGDIVWNVAATPGGYAGWICVAGGLPGTWKAFGAIAE